ncbi:uncharacterized protein LOC117304103 [Asterias rubens]|uniref:uncharacterized protein LOC117304103 n=1 Tax=Asterias rubens TaxID=7604 RepID=UPI001455C76C|nr:uncharacterized protein LOC117304103 [Asterias rubens]
MLVNLTMGPKRKGPRAPANVEPNPATSGEDSPDIDDRRKQSGADSSDFQVFVRATLNKLVEGQRLLEAQLGASIEFNSGRITTLEKNKTEVEGDIRDLKQEVGTLRDQLDRQQSEINKQERFSRRNNFRVVGMERVEGENCLERIEDLLIDKFHWVDAPRIERAHRDGQDRTGKPAHILVKMLSYRDKITVLKSHRSALEGLPLFVVDDLTAKDGAERYKWKLEVKKLYDRGTKLRFFAGFWRNSTGAQHKFD